MTGMTRMTVATFIGFMILGLSFGIGYMLDPTPLADYQDMALVVFLSNRWYFILVAICFVFLLCGLIGEVVLLLFGKVDGDGIY